MTSHDHCAARREHSCLAGGLYFWLLSKEKSDRFATADEVVKILEGELAYQQGPQVEREPSRIWRKARNASDSRQTLRRRQSTTITLAVLIAAISGVWILSTLINSAVDPAVPATNFSVSANEPSGAALGF